MVLGGASEKIKILRAAMKTKSIKKKRKTGRHHGVVKENV